MLVVAGESALALLARTASRPPTQRTTLADVALGTAVDVVLWGAVTFFVVGGLLGLASEGIEATRDRSLERPAVAFALGLVSYGSVVAMLYFFIRGGIFPLLSAVGLVVLLRGVGLFGFFTLGWAVRADRATALGLGSLLAGITAAIPVVNNIIWGLLGGLWMGGVLLGLNESAHEID